MTPTEASLKKNEPTVWRNLYPDGNTEVIVPKFSIGNKIRITKQKGIFSKSFLHRLSEEIFTISGVQYTDPPTYKIIDYNDEEMQGTFYEQELQKTSQDIIYLDWFSVTLVRRK